MKKVLIVIDMQQDFIYGSLANPAAQAIVSNIKAKIEHYLADKNSEVIFTRDTHRSNYLTTQEGNNLPIEHCIYGTPGWCIIDALEQTSCKHINKSSFGHINWDVWIDTEVESIELVGTCTDICVISNALILKALYPEVVMKVDASCCAGLSPEKHEAALEVMRSCQIEVV